MVAAARPGTVMSRLDTGYLLMFVVFAGIFACWLLTHRFTKYERSVRRGNKNAKPVWRPFWMP